MASLVPGIWNLATKPLQDALALLYGHQWRVQFIPMDGQPTRIVTNGCSCGWLGSQTADGSRCRWEWERHVGARV